ncbi:MAG: type II toxin-antitoxin system VapC family toxin [Thermoanaerobaculia bacterium]|nr:type II toxin-antitoxin system VapC family toxin [Thermoanaerobaculia bacterium]
MSVCLDSFALLSWLQGEQGAPIVEGHLSEASTSRGSRCWISAVNLAEVYYRLHRTLGTEPADEFWKGALRGEIPVSVVDATRPRVLEAARLKARFPIALADAFAVQVAREKGVPLVTGDPEIRAVEKAGEVRVEWISR